MSAISLNNQEIILDWCLANPDAIRVYNDGFVGCHVPAYNANFGTSFCDDFFIPVYDFQSYNAGRIGQAGFGFLRWWLPEIAVDQDRIIYSDPMRNQPGGTSNQYVIVTNTDYPVLYRFDKCYFYFLTRRGDPCAFDPAVCCTSGVIPPIVPLHTTRSLVLEARQESGNWFIDGLQLQFPDGTSPQIGDTIEFFYQQGTISELIAQASYTLTGDIDLVLDPPTTSFANIAFNRPDGQTFNMTSWAFAFQSYLIGLASFTIADGKLRIQEYDRTHFALDTGVRMGVMDGYEPGGAFSMDKNLFVRITQAATSDVTDFFMQMPRQSHSAKWAYTTGIDIIENQQDVGMGVICQPNTGLYTGQVFEDSEKLHPLITGTIDSARLALPVGQLEQYLTIPYIFRLDLDHAFTPVQASLVDRMSRFLFSCPAAWAGTQAANNVFYLAQPNNTNNENVLASWDLTHIIPDAAVPNPAVCVSLWDQFNTSGISNVWAGDTAGEFYLMIWDGISTWVRASATPFTNAGVLFKMHFGRNPATGRNYMVVLSHPVGVNFFAAPTVEYWEQTGIVREDPLSWTINEVIENTSDAFELIAGVWDNLAPAIMNRPVIRGITYYKGEVVEWTFDGAVWIRTVVETGILQTNENVAFKHVQNTNAADGTIDSDFLLVSGRQGFNSQNHQLVQYKRTGENGLQTILQKDSKYRSTVGGNRSMMNIVY